MGNLLVFDVPSVVGKFAGIQNRYWLIIILVVLAAIAVFWWMNRRKTT